MSRKEKTEEPDKTEKREKTEKAIKSNLTVEEDKRRQELFRSLIYGKKTQSVDFKDQAELIYLIVTSRIENRELVQDDMKELKAQFECLADRISEIIKKSRTKPSTKRTSVA